MFLQSCVENGGTVSSGFAALSELLTHGLENLFCTHYCALQKRFQVGFPPADLSEGLKFDLENILSPLKIQA